MEKHNKEDEEKISDNGETSQRENSNPTDAKENKTFVDLQNAQGEDLSSEESFEIIDHDTHSNYDATKYKTENEDQKSRDSESGKIEADEASRAHSKCDRGMNDQMKRDQDNVSHTEAAMSSKDNNTEVKFKTNEEKAAPLMPSIFGDKNEKEIDASKSFVNRSNDYNLRSRTKKNEIEEARSRNSHQETNKQLNNSQEHFRQIDQIQVSESPTNEGKTFPPMASRGDATQLGSTQVQEEQSDEEDKETEDYKKMQKRSFPEGKDGLNVRDQPEYSHGRTEINLIQSIQSFNSLTVVFTAVLSRDFDFDPEKERIFISFGPPISDFSDERVEMKIVRNQWLGNAKGDIFIKGSFDFDFRFRGCDIPYKYKIFRNENSLFEWEFIYLNNDPIHANRCLHVPPSVTEKFHKFDDIICQEPFTLKQYQTLHSSYMNNLRNRTQDLRTKASIWTIVCEAIPLALREDLNEAVAVVRQVFKSHGDNGLKILGADRSTSYLNVRNSYKTFEVGRPVLARCKRILDQLLEKKDAESAFNLAIFSFIISQVSEASIDELNFLCKLFQCVKELNNEYQAKVDNIKRNEELCIIARKSLIVVANQFFYLSSMSFISDEEDSSWLNLLPILAAIGTNDDFKQIQVNKWNRRNIRSLDKLFPTLQVFLALPNLDKKLPKWLYSLFPFRQLIQSSHGGIRLIEMSGRTDWISQFLLLDMEKSLSESEIEPASQRLENLLNESPLRERILIETVRFLLENRQKLSQIRPFLLKWLLELMAKFSCELDSDQLTEAHSLVLSSFWNLYLVKNITKEIVLCGKLLEDTQMVSSNLHSSFLRHICTRIKTLEPNECLECFLDHAEELSTEISDPLFQRAYQAICEERSKTGLWTSFKKTFLRSETKIKACQNMIDKFFSESCIWHEDKEKRIQLMSEGTAFRNIFQLISLVQLKKCSRAVQTNFESIGDEIEEFLRSLLNLDVSLSTFMETVCNDEKWNRLLETIQAFEEAADDNFAIPAHHWRKQHVKKFHLFRKAHDGINEFLDFMIMESLAIEENIQSLRPPGITNMTLASVMSKSSDILMFSDDEIDKINWLMRSIKHNQSSFVRIYFKEEWENVRRDDEELDEESIEESESDMHLQICSGVLSRIQSKMEDVAQSIVDEKILLKEIEKCFHRISDEDVAKELRALFKCVSIPCQPPQLEAIVKKVRTMSNMSKYSKAAQVIKKMKEILEIRSPFPVVDRIIQSETERQVFLERELREMQDFGHGSFFDRWTNKEIECLSKVTESSRLVRWCKENMKSLQELKVFVDLATISAGESDQEIDQILCLQTAINGYAPLLFEIEPRVTFPNFLNACQKVFDNLRLNQDLPKTLADSNRNLAWIKEVSDRHGSVESSSLATVDHINHSGVFIISAANLANDLDKLVRLEYKLPDQKSRSQQESENLNRVKSYSEVDELRSKLMLISVRRDSQRLVERFTTVLYQTEVVTKFIKFLNDQGCQMFATVKIQCFMDKSKRVKLMVDFGRDRGIYQGEEELEHELKLFTDFLENALKIWNEHVTELRKNFSCLNHFTCDQLVKLSSDLCSHVEKRSPLKAETRLLLKIACPSIDMNWFDQLLKDMRIFRDVEPVANLESSPRDENQNRFDPLAELKSSSHFKELKEDYGLKEEIIIAALITLKSSNSYNIDNLLDCCSKLREDSENVSRIINRFLIEISSPASQELNESPEQDYDDDFEIIDNSQHRLSTIFQMFLQKNTKNQGSYNFFSFETLGIILDKTIKKFGSNPQRSFPTYFQAGRPNLMICPQKEVYKAVISVYANDETKELPGLDEVLICSQDTTYEQVEILCRRAFADQSGKIYLCMNAECLNYEKSIKIEELFSSTPPLNQNYRIIFVCSKEENDHSYISTAFDKCVVNLPSFPSNKALGKYIKPKLRLSSNSHSKSAASTDPEEMRVRLVTSASPGNGKTLFVKNRQLANDHGRLITISMTTDKVDLPYVIKKFMKKYKTKSRDIFHFDVAENVKKGLDDFIFSLSFLNGLQDQYGQVCLMEEESYFVIEIGGSINVENLSLTSIFPTVSCKAPDAVISLITEDPSNGTTDVQTSGNFLIQLLDSSLFSSAVFQRPYQYLFEYSKDDNNLDFFSYIEPLGLDYVYDCLKTVLHFCPVENPTWAELFHFLSFLNIQLESTEKSIFCNADVMGADLPGFKKFIVKFLIRMSSDFSTRSTEITDESQGEGFCKPVIKDRKRWEQTPHPYVFFNDDGDTLSFFGLFLDGNLNLYAEQTNEILENQVMQNDLYRCLTAQRVQFNKSFDKMSRQEKLQDLCQVFGVQTNDPDPSYELTYDNLMKMLAIQMRFRSNIPVVIMGETGSGKTRLIKFMCDLMNPSKNQNDNMIIMKIHGGITEDQIFKKVENAIAIAKRNAMRNIRQTVLFFDEANTSNAIGTIKSVMCDYIVDGNPIPKDIGLQFVAAVNPYREHSDEMIRKLENAGLGYHIRADQTHDRIGKIPLRRLVYRVKEIPASMFPLIWDFGTLDTATEKVYIRLMIKHRTQQLNFDDRFMETLCDVLSKSQDFMRQQRDECSFVSLRDVERALMVFEWFLALNIYDRLTNCEEITPNFVSLILALGVSYFVKLDEKRQDYEKMIAQILQRSGVRLGTTRKISDIINACQDMFINELRLAPTIAKNDALKENVWMMTVCIELKIPLFLVGKPGSSKSLAKTVVADVMQGAQSYSEFFKSLKEIHLVSFQCSPLATANGILGTFKQCQKFQQERDLRKFTSVVVLDEVGLAEDSEKMPLKALHPLLEDGCVDDEKPEPWKKVAFIGISNWALDPAKMNRGILVSRGVPTKEDLIKSAKGICANDDSILPLMSKTIIKLTDGYMAVHKLQSREYFGLRDFYSIVKMVFADVRNKKEEPNDIQIQFAVQRNFGGFYGSFDPTSEFLKVTGADCLHKIDAKELITNAVTEHSGESRYLLLLTKNNVALRIIQEQSLLRDPLVIFGSSFPRDQEYTQICININKIKIAMELGQTVVLCNLTNLYESLYDALNQNYVMLGGKRYVDLGLGTHRVKCRVHEKFRLIVVAEDTEVFEKFPIPLINRLEKHFLGMRTMLSNSDNELVEELKAWTQSVCKINIPIHKQHLIQQFEPGDVFVGYHDDIVPSMILRLGQDGGSNEVKNKVKKLLLQCATPDAVSRIAETGLSKDQQEEVFKIYYLEQTHNCLSDFLRSLEPNQSLINVTTSSRLLTKIGMNDLSKELKLGEEEITMLSLVQFDTEDQFSKRVKKFLEEMKEERANYLFIQAEVNMSNSLNLIECARYIVQDQIRRSSSEGLVYKVVFIIQVPRVAGGIFTGLSVFPWVSCHIDEIRKSHVDLANIQELRGSTIPQIFEKQLASMRKIIRECMPKSASRLVGSGKRMQDRVERFMNIVYSNSDLGEAFLGILEEKILQALEMETKSQMDPEKWLVRLAIDSPFLKEGNTFQKSIWLYLCQKVSPILDGIIAFCDVDEGLDNLTNCQEEDWGQKRMFLELLKKCDVKDCVRKPNIVDFGGEFPLSRFIIQTLENYGMKNNSTAEQLHGLVEVKFGDMINRTFERGFPVLKRFIHDFVYLTFPNVTSNEDHSEIICQQVFFLAKQAFQLRVKNSRCLKNEAYTERDENLVSEATDQGDAEQIDDPEVHEFVLPVDVYYGYQNTSQRLKVLSSLLEMFPHLSSRLPEPSEDAKVFEMDFLAMREACKAVEPKPEGFKEKAYRDKFSTDVDTITALFRHLQALEVNTCMKLHSETENLLQRLQVIKLYVKNMEICPLDLYDVAFKKMKKLLLILKNNHLKSKKDFDDLLDFLFFVNDAVASHLFPESNEVCIICKEEMKNPMRLQCKHFGCAECLEDYFASRQDEVEWHCPFENCDKIVSKDMEFQSNERSVEVVRTQKEFKTCLNMFFLDVLQSFVFNGLTLPDQEVLKKLMTFIVSQELPKDHIFGTRTKKLSPFAGHCIDPNPVIRSFILQLLLHNDAQEGIAFCYLEMIVEEERKFIKQPQQHLDLLLLIMYCLEDRHFTTSESICFDKNVVVDYQTATRFITADTSNLTTQTETVSSIAKLRLAMTCVAHTLYAVVSHENQSPRQAGQFLEMIAELLNQHQKRRSEHIKKFLVRVLCSHFRKDFIHDWKMSGKALRLMPNELLKTNWDAKKDPFLIIGGLYKLFRDCLKMSLTLGKFDELIHLLETNRHNRHEWNLSLEENVFIEKVSMRHVEALCDSLKESSLNEYEDLARKILINRDNAIRNAFLRVENQRDHSILAVVSHMGSVFEYRKQVGNRLLQPLYLLASERPYRNFMPTMPQDETVEVRNAAEGVTKWFTCSKGHQYGIGDCGQPKQVGTCPTCKELVGGTNYAFALTGRNVQQVQEAVAVDQTKQGHILGQAGNDVCVRMRDLDGLQVSLARFILHSAMLIGMSQNRENLATTIDPHIDPQNIPEFLLNHLRQNLAQIANKLGSNEDDAEILLHNIMQRMSMANNNGNVKGDWNTKQGRQIWENEFARDILNPALEALPNVKEDLVEILKNDKSAAENSLLIVLNEKVSDEVIDIAANPQFWIPREKIEIDNVPHKVGHRRLRDHCPNVSRLLDNEVLLSETSKLPIILKLQTLLIEKFKGRLQSHEISKLTIQEFRQKETFFQDEDEQRQVRYMMNEFIQCFNHLLQNMPSIGVLGNEAIKVLGNDGKLTCNSPAGTLFPSTHREGACAKALVHLLMNGHNTMLRRYLEDAGLPLPLEVKPTDISESQLVRFDRRGLHLTLLANSKYELDVATVESKTQWTLNEVSFEKSVIDRYLTALPLIDVTKAPEFLFQDDEITTADLKDLILQERLSGSMRQSLDFELKKLVDICDVLASVETTKEFLLISGGQPDESLFDRMRKLRLKTQVGSRAMKLLKLCHVDDLIDNLQLMRSKRMLLNKQDPFSNLDDDYKQPLTEPLGNEAVGSLLKRIQYDCLLSKLHKFILHRLSVKRSGDPPEGRLRDYLCAFLEAEEENTGLVNDFWNNMHEDILIANAGDLFSQILKRER